MYPQLPRWTFIPISPIRCSATLRSLSTAASEKQSLRRKRKSSKEHPRKRSFQPYKGTRRKPGTGCISQINETLWEGRYSPRWPDGKKHPRNIYAHTREECEQQLAKMICEVNAEIAVEKAKKTGRLNAE